jgi:hypothetical protein
LFVFLELEKKLGQIQKIVLIAVVQAGGSRGFFNGTVLVTQLRQREGQFTVGLR